MSNTLTAVGMTALSIINPLRPKSPDWKQYIVPFRAEFPLERWMHVSGINVLSAVEVMSDEDKGPEYHLSITFYNPRTKQVERCDSNAARWVVSEFGMDGAEEDNHVPSGKARHFWRTVREDLIGQECKCKAFEPAIVEDKGDYVWRVA